MGSEEAEPEMLPEEIPVVVHAAVNLKTLNLFLDLTIYFHEFLKNNIFSLIGGRGGFTGSRGSGPPTQGGPSTGNTTQQQRTTYTRKS